MHPFLKELMCCTDLQIKMNTTSYKTISANDATVQKEWLLVDAENMVLGRMATKVAVLLRGKHKPYFTPHVDCGDNIIIINADKILLTGHKWDQKEYIRHTGYPGGQRSLTATQVMKKYPTRIVEHAIKGMLPKNRLGRELFRNLAVYAGPDHPHEAQKPRLIDLNEIK